MAHRKKLKPFTVFLSVQLFFFSQSFYSSSSFFDYRQTQPVQLHPNSSHIYLTLWNKLLRIQNKVHLCILIFYSLHVSFISAPSFISYTPTPRQLLYSSTYGTSFDGKGVGEAEKRETKDKQKTKGDMGGVSCYAMTMGTSSEKPLIIGASSSSSPCGVKQKKKYFKAMPFNIFCHLALFSTDASLTFQEGNTTV